MRAAHALSFGPMAVNLGQVIEARMEELGMSQTKLAARSGTPLSTLKRALKASSMDHELIRSLSVALEKNFFHVLAYDLELEAPKLRVLRDPAEEYGEKKSAPVAVRIEMDALDADQQALALDFADKLRRVQERKLK